MNPPHTSAIQGRHCIGPTRALFGLLLLPILMTGCTVKLVADYDGATAEKIGAAAEHVDAFYVRLLDTAEAERGFSPFAEDYRKIEVELGALVLRNKMRELNEESIKMAEKTLELWVKYKDKHKASGEYKTALANIHRKRFGRLFVAIAKAEEAKKMASEGTED